MQVKLVLTFTTKNLTLTIAWKGKNNVFVAASMPWSQLMVQGGRGEIKDFLMEVLQSFSVTKL